MGHPKIISVGTANPPHRFTQEEILAFSPYADRLRRGFFLNSGIEGRYLAIDPERFRPDETIDELAARFEEASIDLGRRALAAALERAGRAPEDIDFLATTTCTGRLCPSLDARLIRELRLREDVQRVHVGDTGCSSAVVALQQAANHLAAFPDHLAAVVAVEVSSTGYYLDDDLETAVANAIFADGAGAMVIAGGGAGARRESDRGPEVLAHGTLFRTEHLPIMGFTYPGGRPRILLSKDVRTVGAEMLAALVRRFLEAHHLALGDIRHWAVHSAGRRVLDGVEENLGLAETDLACPREVLRRFGNMSSATVVFVLEEVLSTRRPGPGDHGLLAALGPGFAAEGALLRW
jgi:predicted naringenin-chalcone synthase